MGVPLTYPNGATPLDPEELADLIPGHITTQGALNEWEQLNITQGEGWAWGQRKQILTEDFVRQLHKKMFGETWRWAGTFRRSDKNIGVEWTRIPAELRKLLGDIEYQVQHGSFPADEIAVRFHHRLVAVHPFPNGNGRHARLMADLLAVKLGRPRFSWGRQSLGSSGVARDQYLTSLRAADDRDLEALMLFARS